MRALAETIREQVVAWVGTNHPDLNRELPRGARLRPQRQEGLTAWHDAALLLTY